MNFVAHGALGGGVSRSLCLGQLRQGAVGGDPRLRAGHSRAAPQRAPGHDVVRVTRRGVAGGRADLSWGRARAQPTEAIRIGLLTDLSGSTRNTSGPTSVACVRQAIDEMRAASPSLAVELLTADHQQKPDVGASVVREWFDRAGVDAVAGVNNSAIAFAVNRVVEDKDKVHLNTAPFSRPYRAGVQPEPRSLDV